MKLSDAESEILKNLRDGKSVPPFRPGDEVLLGRPRSNMLS
ncbi:MAG: hypothetical protein WD273_10710 [Trueperaceae bacterium]